MTKYNKGYNKWTPGEQLWGGLWEGGLIPKSGPLFFSTWLGKECKRIGKKKKTLDNKIYAKFITTTVASLIRRNIGDCEYIIWQDDNDGKQRTKHVLEALSNLFPNRIPVNKLCAKYADVWGIELVWAYLYEKTRGIEFDNIDQMKSHLCKLWRRIDQHLCYQLMHGHTRRLKAVINKKGEQIKHEDWAL